MPLTSAEKELHQETVKTLRGVERRLYMARVAETLGRGGPALLERELGWNRVTLTKGRHELRSGFRCVDDYASRGRQRVESPHISFRSRQASGRHRDEEVGNPGCNQSSMSSD